MCRELGLTILSIQFSFFIYGRSCKEELGIIVYERLYSSVTAFLREHYTPFFFFDLFMFFLF